MAAPVTHEDPGLQPERTRMAWSRTTLALAVVGLLALRQGVESGLDVTLLVLVVLVLVSLVVFNHTRRHRRSVIGITQEWLEPPTSAVLGLGIGTVVLEVIALTVILAA